MLIRLLIRVVVTAGALLLIASYVPGISLSGWYAAVVVAIAWGIIMLTVRPILAILTLPINILTLGLFSFLLNALLFWFLSTIIAGFHVSGFIPALEGSVLLMVVNWALHAALKK
jgi:putative membrane protein